MELPLWAENSATTGPVEQGSISRSSYLASSLVILPVLEQRAPHVLALSSGSEKSLFLREHPFAAKFSSSHLTLVASFDKLPALSLDENNFTAI